METYDWIENRLGEQEERVTNMTPKNIDTDTNGSYTESEMDYLDWVYGMNSKRYDRHFSKMLEMKCTGRRLTNRQKAMGMTTE